MAPMTKVSFFDVCRVEKEVDADSAEAQAAKCSAALSSSDKNTTPGKAPPGTSHYSLVMAPLPSPLFYIYVRNSSSGAKK